MKKIFLLLAFALIIAPGAVMAADALGTGLLVKSAGKLGLQSNLESSAGSVIKGVLVVTGTMFLILTVAAGIMWMLAAGNDERITKARKIIIGSAIGLFISLFAYTITSFVASRLGAAGEEGGNQSCSAQGGICSSAECTGSVYAISASGCGSGQVCCKDK